VPDDEARRVNLIAVFQLPSAVFRTMPSEKPAERWESVRWIGFDSYGNQWAFAEVLEVKDPAKSYRRDHLGASWRKLETAPEGPPLRWSDFMHS
jgi:hypothetical protein